MRGLCLFNKGTTRLFTDIFIIINLHLQRAGCIYSRPAIKIESSQYRSGRIFVVAIPSQPVIFIDKRKPYE